MKNRVRNLVTHWPSDGEWREAVLRSMLRRHIPAGAFVGRGFVVGRDESSTQIDILILRRDKPALFSEGDFAIVAPDAPGAIAEVKTKVVGEDAWYQVIHKLAKNGRLCRRVGENGPWLGTLSYEGSAAHHGVVLQALSRVYRETGIAVNCITAGSDLFVRYWTPGERELGDDGAPDPHRACWRAYDLSNLSPSYFISNLIDGIWPLDRSQTDYVWFALPEGKRSRMLAEQPCE